MSRKIKNLKNMRFGKLLVIELSSKKKSWTMWKCICDCGNIHITYSTHLVRGNVKSCGCDMIKKGPNHVNWTGYGEISGRRWNDIRRMNFSGKRRDRIHLSFTIDIKYAWELFLRQNRKCALSGMNLYFGKSFTASLDRIDNNKGYDEGNVQWIHKDINRMKNIYNQEYFINICEQVYFYTRGIINE